MNLLREWFDSNGPEYRLEFTEGLETVADTLRDAQMVGKANARYYLQLAEGAMQSRILLGDNT